MLGQDLALTLVLNLFRQQRANAILRFFPKLEDDSFRSISVLGALQLGLCLVRRATQPDFLHALIGKNCLLVLVADRPKLKSRMPGRLIGFCQKLAEVTLDYAHAHRSEEHTSE